MHAAEPQTRPNDESSSRMTKATSLPGIQGNTTTSQTLTGGIASHFQGLALQRVPVLQQDWLATQLLHSCVSDILHADFSLRLDENTTEFASSLSIGVGSARVRYQQEIDAYQTELDWSRATRRQSLAV